MKKKDIQKLSNTWKIFMKETNATDPEDKLLALQAAINLHRFAKGGVLRNKDEQQSQKGEEKE